MSTLALRTLGNFMVAVCLFLLAKTLYQPVYEELRFFADDVTRRTYTVSTDTTEATASATPGGFGQFFQQDRVEVLVPDDPEFSLVIPKIGANARVVANVDPGNEAEYLEKLKEGIAHASGTAYPGEGGHVFLFAHSTDYIWNISSYNAVFYLLYKLDIGDEINVFYKGQRYIYEVTEKTIIEPSQVDYLTRKTDYELLTLQTCWPPGTTLKRLVVSGKLKSE